MTFLFCIFLFWGVCSYTYRQWTKHGSWSLTTVFSMLALPHDNCVILGVLLTTLNVKFFVKT